ncbi:MAG: hypothetical protein WBW74_13335 [Xanthobacteraceae bacterium]
MCKIEKCKGKTVAQGLCAKHYMRLRRTGDPLRTEKRGRKTPPCLALSRSTFPEYSQRTIARYAQAMKLLSVCGEGALVEAIKAATRPNGTINVSRFGDIAALVYVSMKRTGTRRTSGRAPRK